MNTTIATKNIIAKHDVIPIFKTPFCGMRAAARDAPRAQNDKTLPSRGFGTRAIPLRGATQIQGP